MTGASPVMAVLRSERDDPVYIEKWKTSTQTVGFLSIYAKKVLRESPENL